MSEPLKIVFGLLTQYEREGWIHPSINQFFCDLPFITGQAMRVIPIHNFKPAASGRNKFCQQLKDSDADWLCMIDNDMHINGDFINTLKGAPEDASIVVPMFYSWMQNTLSNTLCWGMEGVPDGLKKMEPGFHELTKAGTGAIFIKRGILNAIEYPYFTYVYNEDGSMEGTEDIQFCLKARKRGFKIYGNADVRVGHYKSVELSSMWAWAEKAIQMQKPEISLDSAAKLVANSLP